MVAELLRLKGRLLLNGFRRPRSRIVGSTVLVVVAVAGLLVLSTAAARVTALDGAIVGRAVILIGAEITLGCLLIPIMFSRSQLLEPRAFLGYGFRSGTLAAITLLLTLVGPALLIIPAALIPVAAWRHFPEVTHWAVIAAPLLVLQLLLTLRIGVAVGVWLGQFVQWRLWSRVVGVLILLAGLVMITALLLPRAVLQADDRSLSVAAPLARLLRPLNADRVADVVGGSPLASLWGAPALAVAGSGDPSTAIWIGVAVVVVLALLWWALVHGALRPTHRLRITRAERVPGWFRHLPATPAGAVAARSFIYWLRDPRYNIVLGVLPILPIVTALAFLIGGVPPRIGAFVPLALMVLVLAWSTLHNDIAYDSTAIWSQLAAQTRGMHDRLGRIWPVLILGVVLIAIGTPFTVWAQGDSDSLPAVLGINIALLLGGIGVGSALAPRFPYPAPRPGDGPFTFPQASGGSGGAAQAGSFFLTIVVALPPIAATTFWLMGFGGALNWIALFSGIATGVIALVLGIRRGAATFDRRGPELLAFTMQN